MSSVWKLTGLGGVCFVFESLLSWPWCQRVLLKIFVVSMQSLLTWFCIVCGSVCMWVGGKVIEWMHCWKHD